MPGGPHPVQETGGRPPVGRGPLSPGPPGGPPASIFCYIITFTLENIMGKLTGRDSATTRRNLGGTNLGLRQSCSAGETSLREGGNHRHHHHQRSSHREGLNLHQHIHQHHLLSNPSSFLASIFVSKPQIGTCGTKKIHFRDDTCLSQQVTFFVILVHP